MGFILKGCWMIGAVDFLVLMHTKRKKAERSSARPFYQAVSMSDQCLHELTSMMCATSWAVSGLKPNSVTTLGTSGLSEVHGEAS